jgi:hypothetical protein
MAIPRVSFSPLVGMLGRNGSVREQVNTHFDFDEIAGDPAAQGGDPPLPAATLQHGRQFLRLLPASLPVPQVSRDGDDLWFEWVGDGARMVSVLIGSDGVMRYSGRLGARRRISGDEPLEGELPPLLREAIEQVVDG